MAGSHHEQKQGSGVKRKREDEDDDGPGKYSSCVHDVDVMYVGSCYCQQHFTRTLL